MKHIFVYKKEDASLIASSSPNRRVEINFFIFDISTRYFYLRLLKSGKRFESIETVKENSLKELKTIS